MTTIVLTDAERAKLFQQDPAARNDGGFQGLLVSLQERTNANNKLDLTPNDVQRA